MKTYVVAEDYLTDIADAIRDKTGSSEGMEVNEMPSQIRSITGGENGATFIPFIDNEGNLSWTNDKGLENPETVNIKGDTGEIGPKPVKGVDYWTEADQEAMVQQVITALGTPVFGRVDADKNIITTGNLVDGTYTYWYEGKDGKLVKIGTIELGAAYTNMLLKAVEADDTPYNGGQGWKANTRLSSSGAESTSSATGMEVTGFIPFKRGDVIRFKGITMNKNSEHKNGSYFIQYDSNKAMLAQWVVSAFNGAIDNGWVLVDDNYNILQINTGDFDLSDQYTIKENAAYFRISAEEINATSIITINQEITDDSGMGDSGEVELTWTQAKIDKTTGVDGDGSGGYYASQHIDFVDGYAYTASQTNVYGGITICYYGESGNYLGYEELWSAANGDYTKVVERMDGATTFRVRLYNGSGSSIAEECYHVTFEKKSGSYTNWIPKSTEVDGVTLYNGGKGYKENTRWSASGGGDITDAGKYTCGYIPVSYGDVIRLKNIRMNRNDAVSGIANVCTVCFFTSLGVGSAVDAATLTSSFNAKWGEDGNMYEFTAKNTEHKFFRLNTAYIGNDSIVTINELIE